MRRRGGGEEVRKHTPGRTRPTQPGIARDRPRSGGQRCTLRRHERSDGRRCVSVRGSNRGRGRNRGGQAVVRVRGREHEMVQARDQLLRRTLAHLHRKVVGAARHQPRVPAAHHLHLLPSCKPVGPPAAPARTMRTRRSVSKVRREESGGSACCVRQWACVAAQ